jgi:hypothetical protein
MKIYEEVCIECGQPFLNNSVSTSLGCPDCEPFIQGEEYCLRVFGHAMTCYYIVNGEPCGKEAKYALNDPEQSPISSNTRVSAFCREHYQIALAIWASKPVKLEDVEDL